LKPQSIVAHIQGGPEKILLETIDFCC